MKHSKQKNEGVCDQQIMAESVESKGTGVEEHPSWTEEQCLEQWASLVKKSRDKLVTKDGDVMIARARMLVVDSVENNMHFSGIKSQRLITNDEELRVATADQDEAPDRFRRAQHAVRPVLSPVPPQAMRVDAIDGNVTGALQTALHKNALSQSLGQSLVQASIEQAAADEEMMEEVMLDVEKMKAAKAAAKQVVVTPGGTKRMVAALNTFLIEKSPKLDSSIVRLQGDMQPPPMLLGHMSDPKEIQATQAENEHHQETSAKSLRDYVDAVNKWKAFHTLDKLAPNGVIPDYEMLMRQVVDDFKPFFNKDGYAKPFRDAMQSWRKFFQPSREGGQGLGEGHPEEECSTIEAERHRRDGG
jgi:hypothetical protein